MELKFEDLVYEAAKDVLKETIMKEINKKKPEIKLIINELFNKQEIIYFVQEMIKHDDDFADKIKEMALDVIIPKVENLLKNIKDK